jgi:hypothetical protein
MLSSLTNSISQKPDITKVNYPKTKDLWSSWFKAPCNQDSSTSFKLLYDYLKQHFWKEYTSWSDGYFVCAIGQANPDTIRNYIATQG